MTQTIFPHPYKGGEEKGGRKGGGGEPAEEKRKPPHLPSWQPGLLAECDSNKTTMGTALQDVHFLRHPRFFPAPPPLVSLVQFREDGGGGGDGGGEGEGEEGGDGGISLHYSILGL